MTLTRPILKGKEKGEVNKKVNYKQEKKEESYSKQKEASDKLDKYTTNRANLLPNFISK